jgi:hypothetical protein
MQINARIFEFVLAASVIIGIGVIVVLAVGYKTPPVVPPSDMKLVSGNPRTDRVSVFHDAKRAMTCYVETQHGGIFCEPDIYIEDQLHMLAYRDAGN